MDGVPFLDKPVLAQGRVRTDVVAMANQLHSSLLLLFLLLQGAGSFVEEPLQ